MAYVVWRVLMKKYCKVRLGIQRNPNLVTPSSRDNASASTNEEHSSWKAADSQEDLVEEGNLTRSDSFRKSKTHRVKGYLRRCKDVLAPQRNGTSKTSNVQESDSEPGRSAWYVAQDKPTLDASEPMDKCCDESPSKSDEVIDTVSSESVIADRISLSEEIDCVTSELANVSVLHREEESIHAVQDKNADDVQDSLCSMLDRVLSPVIPYYRNVRNALLRQARDLLLFTYGGSLSEFERCFLAPAALLIASILRTPNQTRGIVVSGWPVTLSSGGLVLHLGELDSAFLVRPGDCYLCVRACTDTSQSLVELAVIWRSSDKELRSRSLSVGPASGLSLQMDVLPDLLRGLLVTVERAVERAPLEALAFPCPLCGRCYSSWNDSGGNVMDCVCRCREVASSTQEQCVADQTGPVFALGGSIPHIDSDEDDDAPSKRLSAMTGMLTKLPHDVVPPKAIKELSEKLLTCGITFPGTRDVSGRPIVIVDAAELIRAGLSCFEVATLLLYYTSLPSEDSLQRGIAVLVLLDGSDKQDVRVWELLDTSLLLLASHVAAQIVLSWEPTTNKEEMLLPAWRRDEPAFLPCSRIQCHRCTDSESLSLYMSRHQTPERCGGSARHDQREWTRFFREYEAFRERCCDAGRRLLNEAAECNATEEHTGKMSRKMVHRQHRALSRSLLCPALRALRRDAPGLLQALSQRAAAAGASDEVAAALVAARRLAAEVERACAGLEQLAERRRERLRELAREQALEHETDEVLSWMRHSGEDALQSYDVSVSSANNQDAKRQEQDFEHFYFISMRQLDRGADLCEEAAKRSHSPLQDTARSLRAQMRGFSQRLEATRERLEESARVRLHAQGDWDCNDDRGGDSGIGACVNCEDQHQRVANTNVLDRSCSCRCYSDPDPERADGSEGCPMSNCTDELEDESFEPQSSTPKPRGPLEVNSHLHCHASNIDLPNVNDVPGAIDIDPKTYKTLLLITREMIQTERDYVKSLDYIIENYLPELLRDDIPQALRGQRNVVFGNVEKIYEFHNQHFLRELERCETNPLQIGQSFLRHEKKFYLYALYNKNKPKSDSLMSEYGSSFFKSKQLELCDKMDLASYLLKPVQRMGKYALLLQQLMKAASPEGDNSADLEDLRAAEQMVRFQLRHGNDLLAMDSLRECDVNVKEQGRLLRQNEFLVWEGKSGKKSMRQVFLFEDLILFSKARRFPDHKNLDLYIYKNSIKTSDIGLTARIGDSSTKFEIWFRKRKPNDTFTLQPMSEDVKKAWTEEISQLLWKQALRNREVRLAEMSSMGIGNKPCLDIRPSIDQISDRSISIAQLSKTAPRFRNSISSSICSEMSLRVAKRPHSIISVSSVSSGGSSSTSSASGGSTTSGMMSHTNTTDSLGQIVATGKIPHHRSTTLNSQCSAESGILADMSLTDDIIPGNNHSWNGLSKSNSSASSVENQKIQSAAEELPAPNDTCVIHDNSSISNCSSCNQMPLLLYQNDQEMTVNL